MDVSLWLVDKDIKSALANEWFFDSPDSAEDFRRDQQNHEELSLFVVTATINPLTIEKVD